jgi:sulfite reductase (NADPH) flavoprotein alpha-component
MPHSELADVLDKSALQEETWHEREKLFETPLDSISPVFPFGTPEQISKVYGSGYLTAQTLVQQVAYSLSDRLFTYSPESFNLDDAVRKWSSAVQANARGKVTSVQPMETRFGRCERASGLHLLGE